MVFTCLSFCQSKFTEAPRKVPLPPANNRDAHVREMFANSQVRAVRIDLEAGESTATAQHDRDFVIVSIGDSDFEFIGPVNSVPMSMHDSEVQVLKGHWPHRVHNKSQRALHLVEIEVARGIVPERAVCGLNAPSCRESRFAYNEHDRYTTGTLFETPTIKLAKVEIDPQSDMPEHGHPGDHVMIALTDASLTSTEVGGASKDFNGHPGDAMWLAGGMVHSLANHGAQKASFLTIDCK